MTAMKRVAVVICVATVFAGAATGDPALFFLGLIVGLAVGFGFNDDGGEKP